MPVLLAEVELVLRQGDYKAAIAVTGDLVDTLRQYGMQAYMPKALYLQGQALYSMGQGDSARDRWLEAHAEADSMSARRPLWRVLVALSQIEADPAEAIRLQ